MSAETVVAFSIDVEWAHPVILNDLRALLDDRGITATFFCTHANIDVGHHERGLHPNFRGDGDCLKAFVRANGLAALTNQTDVYRFVVQYFKAFAPEAVGVRGHSLHYDSQLLDIYRAAGIGYDASYQMPLLDGLAPFWKEGDIVEIPLFYNDYFDLKTQASAFQGSNVRLDTPGLKVINVHPNIIYTNAPSLEFYAAAKAFYHQPEALLARRHQGRGARDLFLDLMDQAVDRGLSIRTLKQINEAWRQTSACPWSC